MIKRSLALFTLTVLAGCGSWSPWSGPVEQSRLPRDAQVYRCDGGRTLAVRQLDKGESMMVIYPEREFRLERIGEGRYSNGRTLLQMEGDEAWVEEEKGRVYDGCKKQSG